MRIGAGVANGMGYLLTWNGTHIANAAIRGKIEHTCRGPGLQPPIICTPEETPNGENPSNDQGQWTGLLDAI